MSSLPPPPAPSTLPPPPGARWGLGDVGASVGIFFGMSLVLGLAAYAATGTADVLEGVWLPVAVGVPPLVQLFHGYWVANHKGRGVAIDWKLRARPSDLAVGAGLCVMGLIGGGLVNAIVIELTDREPDAAVAEAIEDSAGGGGITVWIVVMALAAVLLVPLVEELVYRGMLWSALAKRGVPDAVSLVVTSLVFAAFHIEPYRFPVLFVLGLALGYGRIQTGRLGPCIAGHALINGIGMTFLLIEVA